MPAAERETLVAGKYQRLIVVPDGPFWVMNADIDPQSELTVGIVYVEPHQTNPLHIHPNSASQGWLGSMLLEREDFDGSTHPWCGGAQSRKPNPPARKTKRLIARGFQVHIL